MRKKSIILMLVVFMLLNVASLGLLIVSTTASPIVELPEYVAVDINSGLAGNVASPVLNLESGAYQSIGDFESTPPEGTSVYDWYLDALTGYTGNPMMTLRKVIGNVEIWTQDDMSFPEGDPRNDDPYNTMISDAMMDYLAEEFNDVIYPTCVEFFGMPYDRYGDDTIFELLGWPIEEWDWIETDNPQRVIIKILNERDDNFYDPTYPYYVAGFFADLYDDVYYDRNMIHLDSWRWWQRLGDEGTQWIPERSDLVVTRPNLYDGVTAHEYQHLIHHDHNPADELWMNEGCSTFAEILCGYPVDWSSINSFLATPDNSLTDWGDQGNINILADYGQVQLFATYINDQYSTDIQFLSEFIGTGLPGVEGINAALTSLGHTVQFEDIFKDWQLANLIHSGDGLYNYKTIDFNDPEAGELSVYEVKEKWPTDFHGTDIGNTFSILGYDTGVSRVGSYGTDYILLSKLKWQKDPELQFNGDEFAWTPHWDKDGTVWYSSSSESLTALDLFLDVTLTGDSVLTIDTMYEIEEGWDFGIVQIYNESSGEWVSLENDYTTFDNWGTTDEILASLPGLTGDSGGWITMDFDLSGYTGPVTLRFSYMTDWGYQDPGWWIDNVKIDGVQVSEDDYWDLYDPPATSFIVTVIRQDFWEGEYYFSLVTEMVLDANNEGTIDLAPFLSSPGPKLRYPDVILAITPRVGIADYSFSVVRT